jgi:iron-sulfur cluster assembly accessory protein
MILVTDQAQTQLSKILPLGGRFRILIESGGCSGFEKKFEICNDIRPDDFNFGHVLIDPQSLELLGNATLDYKISLGEQKFVLDIPQASISCGCGKSFNF